MKQPEEILGVQFSNVEVSADINTTKNVLGEEGGVDGEGFGRVLGVENGVEKRRCQFVELFEAEGGCLGGGAEG